MKINLLMRTRLRRASAMAALCFYTAAMTGCYTGSTPRAACLDPLAAYQNNSGPSPSQMYAAPIVPANEMMSVPTASTAVTMETSELPATVMPASATMSVEQTAATALPCPLGRACQSPMQGGCPDGSCSACTTWQPNCLPQYCNNPQEYLCDGGDKPPLVKVDVNNQPMGLGTQDTVVTYDNRDGRPEVAASNCVCVYAPRFAAVRKVSTAAAGGRAIAAVGFDVPASATPMAGRVPGVVISDIQEPLRERLVRGPDAYKERNRAVPVMAEQRLLQARDVLEVFAGISVLETGVLKDQDRALLRSSALAAIVWTGRDVVDVIIDEQHAIESIKDRTAEELKVYEVQGRGKVRICKVADRGAAQIGDTVTFVLRVDNVGDAPVDSVVVSDNLTTRLEYIEGSQACTKGAIFKAKPNEAGSMTVSWELTDDMKVGEGCIIRFRCKVR